MGIKYKINQNFFKSWSPNMAYVLGFIAADGSLQNTPYMRGKYISICSKDIEVLRKIKAVLDSEHTIVTIKPRAFVLRGKTYISKEQYKLRIGNHEIYNDLFNLGITPQKSNTINFPKIPNEFIAHFLRGYLDGDGCISIYNKKQRLSVTFTSGSEDFLWRLSEVISLTLKIKRHNVFSNHWAFQVKYSTREAVPLLKYCYSEIEDGLYLGRKYNKFLDFFGLYPKWQEYNGVVPKRLRELSAKQLFTGSSPVHALNFAEQNS